MASPMLREPWLSALVEHGRDLITLHDDAGRISYAAPSLTHILGYPLEEFLARPLTAFVHEDDQALVVAHFALLQDNPGIPRTVEYRLRHRGGRWRWVQATGTNLLSDPSVQAVVMNQHDITPQRDAEVALRESEHRFRALVESSEDCIELASPRGSIAYMSPAALTVFGREPEELVGRNIFELIHPDERDRVAGLWQRTLDLPGQPVRAEFRHVHGSGEDRYLETVRVNHLDTPGLNAVVTIYRDVTQRYALEEQVRQAQKMEAVGRLAGGIAHDFNNILSAIHGFASIIKQDLGAQHVLQEDVDEILRSVARAAALTRQLLAFGRKQVLQPRALDVGSALQDMQETLRRVIGETIELRIVADESPLPARVDPAQFEQVVMDLVVNARDAMASGGVLKISAGHETLAESDSARFADLLPGAYVTVKVSDTGQGMSRELQERIFEPFFSTKNKGQGSVLGLATVFGVVKQSGGHITVNSVPGEGSTFRVYFPVAKQPALQNSTTLPLSSAVHAGNETILLVDDETSVRSFVARMLRKYGYQVLDAASGAEAMLLSGQHGGPIHLLLTDVVMPRISGPQVAERLVTARPDMRVLFMSGYAEDAIIKQGVLRPGADLIEKPLTADTLGRKVREILDRADQPKAMSVSSEA